MIESNRMKKIKTLVITLLGVFLAYSSVFAQFKVAVVGKTKNDSFYMQAFDGCLQFAATVDDLTCIYDGPADYQDPRSQVRVVEHLLEQDVDGILIATTNSDFLVERMLKLTDKVNIPVITFDSDLLPEHQRYRLAYVGTNNFDFGVALGEYAKRYKKNDQTEICIQSGSDSTPNLNDRIRGVRFALSGDYSNERLTGQSGWIEHSRCPFYTLGKRDNALKQLKFILSQESPPLFLAVAGFAQFSPDYIAEIMQYQQQIRSGKHVVISADAEAIQLEALKLNLSTVNIGQRPQEMGRYSAELMYDVLKHNKMPEQQINYLGFYYCTAEGQVNCSTSDSALSR